MDQNRLALLALHFIPGIGDFLIKQLVSYCGSPEEVFKTSKSRLLKIPGVGEATYASIQSGDPFREAEDEITKAEQNDTHMIFYIDPNYPQRLKVIDDSPSLLYVKGNVNLNMNKTVGLVGTRLATDYGKEVVEKIVKSLVPHHPLIVSGLAYGIDIHAHKESLKHNLPTLAVMGSGIDVIYPSVHTEVAKRMLSCGGIATENPFGRKPDAHNFPARNRIIAGLCDALIVIEAAERGGALITAEIANTYNKDVFAIPGNIDQTYSQGCNKLIRSNKAHLMTDVGDLEYIMNWRVKTDEDVAESQQLNLSLFDAEEQLVVNLLQGKKDPMMIDELSRKSALSPSTLATLLLNLEFKNVVRSLPGKMYRLVKNQ